MLSSVFFNKTNYQTLSDEDLLRHIARGAEDAFSELYRRYGTRMHRFFCRMLGRHGSHADDFTQELFLKIIEKPERFDPERRFSTWIYTVAGNMCKNEYRRRGRDAVTDVIPDQVLESDLPQQLDRLLFNHRLETALDHLNADQRLCFALRYQEELSMREIAQMLDCPEGTVRSRLFYSLRHLAAHLKVFQLI